MEPEVKVPATESTPAASPLGDANKKLFGIAAIFFAVGVVVVAAIVLIPFSKQYLAERKENVTAELDLKREQLKLEEAKTTAAIEQQNRDIVAADQKAKDDAVAKEKDTSCATLAAKYFADNNVTLSNGWSGKTQNSRYINSHNNTRTGHCLLEVEFGIGQTTTVIFDVSADAELGRYDEWTEPPQDGSPAIDPRKESADKLMSE